MTIHDEEEADRARASLALSVAAYASGMSLEELRGRIRGGREAALARQVAMYLAHVACGMSLARTGLAFRRDRSTVAHACHSIEDRREDPGFDAWISALEDMMSAAPRPALRSPAEARR